MPEGILINGSKMDRAYFQENLEEAKGYSWKVVSSASIEDHQHCIVCTKTVPDDKDVSLYNSKNIFLCRYCHEHYLN